MRLAEMLTRLSVVFAMVGCAEKNVTVVPLPTELSRPPRPVVLDEPVTAMEPSTGDHTSDLPSESSPPEEPEPIAASDGEVEIVLIAPPLATSYFPKSLPLGPVLPALPAAAQPNDVTPAASEPPSPSEPPSASERDSAFPAPAPPSKSSDVTSVVIDPAGDLDQPEVVNNRTMDAEGVDPAGQLSSEFEAEMANLLAGLVRTNAEESHSPEVEASPLPGADHAPFDAILKASVRHERVDYAKIARDHSEALDRYLDDMANADVSALDREQQLAFYFNLYNATMIRAVLDALRTDPKWTPASDSFAVFDRPIVRLRERKISLNALENDVLRKEFKEPRLHVALVCGARSCPPLIPSPYSAATLDATLDANFRAFLSSGYRNRIDRSAQTLYLSQLFNWYAEDFGGKDAIASYVNRFVDGDVSSYKVEFIEYHWDLNRVESP